MIKKVFWVILFIVILVLPNPGLAQTEEAIDSFQVKISINPDSTVDVREEIDYFFSEPRRGIFRKLPFRYKDESQNKNFETPLKDVYVTDEKNTPYVYSQSNEENFLVVKIGNPNATVKGSKTYIISYNVMGALNYFSDHDELFWNLTGNEWEVPIGKVSAEIFMPGNVDVSQIKTTCYTGRTGSKEQNCQSFPKNPATFSSLKGPMTIVLGWNKGIVTQVERQYEQSSEFDQIWNKIHFESGWLLLLPTLILILLLGRYFRLGRDPAGRGTIAPEFEPPDGLKPAEMGTLLDERADSQDITATIIDLAVRGYLKIKEKDKKYTLIKVKTSDAGLEDFEKLIFQAILSGKNEVELKNIRQTFSSETESIRQRIYHRLVHKHKFFLQNPDKTRRRWYWTGCLVMFLSPFLFIFSIILSFSSFLSGLMILAFGRSTPKKTRKGVIAKEKTLGFKEFLYRAERYRVRWQEKENYLPDGSQVFEQYLPYALVLGIADKWAKNFEKIYETQPDWYQGDFATFNAVILASHLNAFSVSAQTSFSAPASTSASSGFSGFGGGGSSGGGMGGGGGGSW